MYQGDDENDAMQQNDYVFMIDEKLLIDPLRVVIRKLIGEGSYSVVYEGEYESKLVAVKIIQPQRTASVIHEHKLRFQREVTLQSRINHPNVVKLLGACVDPAMFIITELMRGGTLQKYLRNLRPRRLDLKLAIMFALDISQAMECLHDNGIIHRDLKPSNLLLTEDNKRVKVGDFGLAREEISGEMTCEAGTYRWMAPELFSKEAIRNGMKKCYDHKVDVYSFSIVLWELLTNKAPFKGRDNITVAYAALANNERPGLEDVPKDMAPLLQSCWSEDPHIRPEFMEITEYLRNYYKILWPTEMTPPRPIQIEDTGNEEYADTDNSSRKAKEKKCKRGSSCLVICFSDCLSD